MRLLLFEIDDTLVWMKGAAFAAVVRALHEVYGILPRTARYSADGRTEPQVARDLLRRSGLGPEVVDAGLERWADALPWALRALLPEYGVEACPGVTELLAALCARDDVLLGLLTGSLESTAPIKLRATGLEPETFRVGAYGSDDADRRQLPAIAVLRAEEVLDRVLMHHEVVVVGAAPAEIACARSYGARAIGVATGHYNMDELRRYEPDHVLPDLRDVEQALDCLLR